MSYGTHIETCKALVLNADFRPLSYFPLSVWPWQEAVKAVFADRVDIVAEYDVTARSPSCEIRLPSVIALRDYQPLDRSPAFTRFNVFLRDEFTCQYCGQMLPPHELTFDHVVPRSAGGRTTWANVCAACESCNATKANRTDMRPMRTPRRPTIEGLNKVGTRFPPPVLYDGWREFLAFAPDAKPWPYPGRRSERDSAGKAFPAGMTDGEYWGAQLES
jgi:5-methylcytosine-specific restriction endonuclease McrA